MKKKIIQSKLTKNNNLSKTKETEKVLEKMVAALNEHRIEDIGEFFSSTFNWFGNYGCGTKKGLKEFQNNWQVPFQKAFSNKVCIDEARIVVGEWGASALKPTIGSNTRKLSINCISVTNVINGIK